jgi:UPF0716 protein FxsA
MIFLLCLFLPVLEIYLLFRVGSVVGFWPVFTWVLLTAWLGLRVIRAQGFSLLRRMRLSPGEDPRQEILESLVVLLSGILLLLPGFLSDALGLLGLFPPTRKILSRLLKIWLSAKAARGTVVVFKSPQEPREIREVKDVTPPKTDH